MYVGIDLGTTYCAVAYKNETSLDVIYFPPQGNKSMASVVAFGEDVIMYNLDAKNLNRSQPETYLYDSKRFIGKTFDYFSKYFDENEMNFKIENDTNNKPTYSVNYKNEIRKFKPEEVSALILRELKRITEEKTGQNIEGCVITVPAHFTNNEREATLFAAELAGLNVIQLLNEPSAAAIAYGIERSIEGYILVFDFGGGTLDISVVNIEDIRKNKIVVLGYGGDQKLGGRDIDNILFNYCTECFQADFGIAHDTPKKKAILLENCEFAKISLSEGRKPKVDIFDWNHEKKTILTKEKFEVLCKPYFEKAMNAMKKLLLDVVNIDKDKIKDVVMTGGSSNIIFIQKMIEEFFGKKPKCYDTITAIAKGAAIVAYDKKKEFKNLDLVDQVKYSLGVESKNSNGDRALFSKIIKSRTQLPCDGEKTFKTTLDNQVSCAIKIAEGEEDYFEENSFIDQFILENLPIKKAGEVTIKILLSVDRSGMLVVTAEENTSGIKKSLEIKKEGSFYKQNEKLLIKKSFMDFIVNE